MMKVLIVATTSYAGMGPYVTNIYNLFSPEDEVYFFGREYKEEYFRKNIKPELLPLCKFYYRSNTRWHTLIDLFFADTEFEDQVLSYCKLNNINIVHYINRPIYKTMFVKLHKLGVRTLGTVHDLHVHETSSKWYKKFRMYWVGQNLARDFLLSDNLLTNSPQQYDEIKKIGPQKNVFYQAFPSLVTSDIEKGTQTPPELVGLSKPYILFFGRVDEYKGIDYLVEAYSSERNIYKNYDLVIAGGGIVKFTWRKEGVVFINRYINDSEIRCLYEQASCVVYPYISATQSGVLSIAFYFKTPVLTSDVPFFKSIVEPYNAGITFRKCDSEDLKLKLLRILRQNNDDIIANETQYYTKYYTISSYKIQLLDIYKSLL